MIVVSDTSPILNLRRINRLELLSSLYTQVLIPPAVFAELGANTGHVDTMGVYSSLRVEAPRNQLRVRELQRNLDAGEAEAIVLAVECGADLLLVDERRGRRAAEAAGLRITGLLGVLADAKRVGLIDRVKPVMDDLIEHARFWISRDLYNAVLAELGE